MCGRYEFTAGENEPLRRIVRSLEKRCGSGMWKPGEIRPTDTAPVLRQENGVIRPALLGWGFSLNGKTVINARAETVAQKVLFADSLRHRRCIVPAAAFYEWDNAGRKYLFRPPDGQALWMAGLYEQREGRESFCIVTTAANSSMAGIHDRMSLILSREAAADWLTDTEAARRLLGAVPAALDRQALDGQLGLW